MSGNSEDEFKSALPSPENALQHYISSSASKETSVANESETVETEGAGRKENEPIETKVEVVKPLEVVAKPAVTVKEQKDTVEEPNRGPKVEFFSSPPTQLVTDSKAASPEQEAREPKGKEKMPSPIDLKSPALDILSAYSSAATSDKTTLKVAQSQTQTETGEEAQEQQVYVSKLDAGIAILLTKNLSILELPSILLPENTKTGSILKIRTFRDEQAEARRIQEFIQLQQDILVDFNVSV
jgi:hypothetical protein